MSKSGLIKEMRNRLKALFLNKSDNVLRKMKHFLLTQHTPTGSMILFHAVQTLRLQVSSKKLRKS